MRGKGADRGRDRGHHRIPGGENPGKRIKRKEKRGKRRKSPGEKDQSGIISLIAKNFVT